MYISLDSPRHTLPDSSDQTIRRLQQENKKLKKTLGQKGKELEQKNEELDLERGLWKTRQASTSQWMQAGQRSCTGLRR